MSLFYRSLLDLIFPRLCLACRAVLGPQAVHLCVSCLASLPSAQLENPSQKAVFMEKFHGMLPVTEAFSLYYFSKKGRVQQLLHRLKYDQQREALLFLGKQLGRKMALAGQAKNFDWVVPIPLHPKRERMRGYNQSVCFAQGIVQALQSPQLAQLLRRDIHTSTQTAMGKEERWRNMRQVFSLSPGAGPVLQGKNVLLVDDLVTTGATLSAGGAPLLTAAPATLSLATLAWTS